MNSSTNVNVAAIERLVRHAEYLRQINSNRAFSYGWKSRVMNVVTIAMSSAVAFLAFSGPDVLHVQLKGLLDVPVPRLQLILNAIILTLVIFTISTLIFQFTERTMRHEEAIRRITEFIGPYSDTVRAARAGELVVTLEDAQRAQDRYQLMAGGIPPSTDRQFERARKDYRKKRRGSNETDPATGDSRETPSIRLEKLVRNSAWTMNILVALRDAESTTELWLWGGAIRNLVWDALQGNAHTPLEDVDVVLYDPNDSRKERDESLAKALTASAPHAKWDVHNQARPRRDTTAPSSLRDAVSASPETFSAVAVRMNGETLEILCPRGLDDLFSMTIRPTSSGLADRVRARADTKAWATIWPAVTFADHQS